MMPAVRVLQVAAILASMALPPSALATGVAPPSPDAVEAVRAYSRAFAARDLDTVASLTHPVMLLREGGAAGFRAWLEMAIDSLHKSGALPASESLGPPSAMFVDGDTRALAVPVLRSNGRTITAMDYLAISYDAGRTWRILDLACTDERWLKGLLPTWRGTPGLLPIHPDTPSDPAENASRIPKDQTH